MQDKLWDFIKRVVGSSTTKTDFYDFEEAVKEKVIDIYKNGSSLSKEQWLAYYNTQQRDVTYAMMKSPYTPDDIIKKISEKMTNPQKIMEMLKTRPVSQETMKIILNNEDHWRTIKMSAFNAFEKNQPLDMHPENINIIANLAFTKPCNPLEDSRYCILAFVKDEGIIESMAKSEYLNENALEYMIENMYISEKLKDKLFDGIGFNYNDIECPIDVLTRNLTPHIAETVYEVSIDTIDGVLSGKITRPNGCTKTFLRLVAETIISDMAIHNTLTEATQLDYLHRFQNMSDKRISEDTAKNIIKHTRFSSVLDFAYDSFNKNIKRECLKNKNASYRILSDAMNSYTKQIQKAISGKGSVPANVEQGIATIASRKSVTPEQIEAIMMWFGNSTHIISNVCECQANAKDVFDKMNERLENCDSSTYAKLAVKTRIVMDGEYFNITEMMLKFLRVSSNTLTSQMKPDMNVIDCPYAKEIASKPELRKKYEKWLDDLRNNFTLTRAEKDVLENMEIIFRVNKERYEKDKNFDPKINSAYFLYQKLLDIGNKIVRCPTIYDMYINIDEWQKEYVRIERELFQKEEYKEFKKAIEDREI